MAPRTFNSRAGQADSSKERVRRVDPAPPISVMEIYPVAEFQRRAGMSVSALRAARRRGLSILRTGKRAYVSGQDFLDFLRAQNRSS